MDDDDDYKLANLMYAIATCILVLFAVTGIAGLAGFLWGIDMTKEDIVNWANKAGFLIDTHAQQYQPNCILSTYGLIDEQLTRFAALVAAAEREACVKLCDDLIGTRAMAVHCADAIRARGTT